MVTPTEFAVAHRRRGGCGVGRFGWTAQEGSWPSAHCYRLCEVNAPTPDGAAGLTYACSESMAVAYVPQRQLGEAASQLLADPRERASEHGSASVAGLAQLLASLSGSAAVSAPPAPIIAECSVVEEGVGKGGGAAVVVVVVVAHVVGAW